MTPFIVTSEDERQAALERLALLAKFPAGSPQAAEHGALLEAVALFEQEQAARSGQPDELAR
ncbi:hypothetical protein ACXIUS_08940 [Bosea thiooxidans]|nr:hypothetical protein [Bosea sp. (in: a-proteobacteria)]